MIITENYPPYAKGIRLAAPAPAREIVRANTDGLTVVDAVGNGAVATSESPRVIELRRQFQLGAYMVNCEELSLRILTAHLVPADPYQR